VEDPRAAAPSLAAQEQRAIELPHASYLQAALWMVGAVVGFSLVAVAAREASRSMSTLEVLLWRSWLSVLLLVVLVRPFIGGWAAFRSHAIGWHALRNAAHGTAQYCWFYALTIIPLAQLFALEFTAPLWIVLLAPVLIGERLTRVRILAAAIGFAGAMLAVKPVGLKIEPGAIYALTAAVLFAISLILVKRIVRTDSVWAVLLNMSWMQGLACLALLLPDLRLPGLGAFGWTVLVAIAGTVAHLSLTRALTLADVMLVAPLDYLRLPLIALVGTLLYAEPLDPLVLAGGAIILAGNFLNLKAERRGRVG
jgi:drug/metabolite transporter (DMT)-like permease